MTNPVGVLARILEQTHARPEHLAARDLDEEFTYGALREEVSRVAASLVARGIRPGDRVALDLPNCANFVLAALACLWVGAVLVPLGVSDPDARVLTILGDCTPALVIGPVEYDPVDQRAQVRVQFPWVSIGELRLPGGSPAPSPLTDGNGPAYAIYTSGTTGTPKGVLIGQQAFAAAVHATAAACGLHDNSRTLVVSPFHFDGSFAALFPTLYTGGTVILRPREALLFPRTFFRAVTREGVTYTGFSPSYLRLLLSSPQISMLVNSTLEVIALGGEASSIADLHNFWDLVPQVNLLNRYGPTETTIAVTHVALSPELIAGGAVPIGRPHPDVRFFLVEEGRVIDEPDHVGELYIAGSQLMTGYWGAPELTAQVLRDDVIAGETVYKTGDLMYRDEHGDYVYVGRSDRVIKRSGVRISLIELSEAVRQVPGVSAGACVMFDNDGELGIAAFVVTQATEAGEPDAVELRREAGAILPSTMLPDRFELVDALPLTGSSKLDERGLLAAAGLREWREPSAARTPSS